jgi:hypothetical protein
MSLIGKPVPTFPGHALEPRHDLVRHHAGSTGRRAANHQHGIDAHVVDAAVLGEAALPHEAMHSCGGSEVRIILRR